MKKFYLAFGFLAFLWILPLLGQAESAISVKARAWPRSVTVGGEVRLLISVTRLKGFSVDSPAPSLNISPFEMKSVRRLSALEENGVAQENFELVVTAFSVGDLKIPSIPIFYRSSSGETGSVLTPPIAVKIVSVISTGGGKDSVKDIRPIKNVISLAPHLLRSIVLGGLAFILSVILAVRIILRRKKRKSPEDPEAHLAAHRRAELELERLQKKELLLSGKIKEHYSELSAILKRYLDRRYKLLTSDLTTAEVGALLKRNNFESSVCAKVMEILEASDLVKFANWNPPRALGDQLAQHFLNLVEETRQEENPVEKK